MALTQTQVIQSLGEALNWFEKELDWGVPEQELRHLTGRIGELYAAMTTRGQMALNANQRGYDIVSGDNERVSVKCITSSTHVSFRKSTFEQVDRIIVLRINVDKDEGVEIEELYDLSREEFLAICIMSGGQYQLYTSTTRREIRPIEHLAEKQSARWLDYEIRQYENGKITLMHKGATIEPVKPELRKIAEDLGVDINSDGGRPKTTHQLGANVLRQLAAK
ncbi:MAG: hypothetical protein WA957_08845 [Alteraurantiacibacter sp.]